jgi:signal transduction histidine kinase
MPEETIESATESIESLRERLELLQKQLDTVHRVSAALSSKRDLDSLLRETLRISLITVDADAGSILLYNPERRRLVFSHVVGKTELIGQEIDPEENRTGKAAMAFRHGQSLLTLDPQAESYDSRFDSTTGYKTQSILTVPLKNMGGEPIGVMQALNKRHGEFTLDDQDLLEILSSLAATSIVNAKLAEEAQLAAVTRAVGDLGHDIKNALTPIETMVDTTVNVFIAPMFDRLDQLESHITPEYPQIAEQIHQSTEALRQWYPEVLSSVSDGCTDIREMVSEIADYIKGTQSTYIVRNNLGEVIEERLRRLRVLAQTRRVKLHVEGMDCVLPFAFDRRLVGRAVYNLVNNAIGAINDAVKCKTLPLRPFNIWVRARTEGPDRPFPEGAYCLIEVQDDGPGIPPDVKASLFTPNTISTTQGGTGIGTRFVKGVADAHNGLAGVESELGHGARFWLKLPLDLEETHMGVGC